MLKSIILTIALFFSLPLLADMKLDKDFSGTVRIEGYTNIRIEEYKNGELKASHIEDYPWKNWKFTQPIVKHYVLLGNGKFLEDEWGQPIWYSSRKDADKARKSYNNREKIEALREQIRKLSE